ncbi:hypothetical protein WT25_11055 [Burkholderia territorii]|uniref:hypothetical protein n=1 Tax=Burkholderia territorii TaxID=1503055 RepID=UPI0007595762|nr:hypothetical protein [Burkholderia territorii]KVT86284.1 hypothetical protein WT25_11055 [Burkholderia territorii]
MADRFDHRKVYARGFYDGMEAMRMTPQRQKQLLEGQTQQARNLFEFIPIQDTWPANRISAEMKSKKGSAYDFKTVVACLGALKDAGLIREQRGNFQRVEVRERVAASNVTALDEVDKTMEKPSGTSSDGSGEYQIVSRDQDGYVDVLGTIGAFSCRLIGITNDIKNLSDDLDKAALAIADEMEKNGGEADILKKFRALLLKD